MVSVRNMHRIIGKNVMLKEMGVTNNNKCKIEKQLPNIDIFRKKLLYRYKIEEYNAQMSCSCSNFSSRWEPYKPFFAG